MPFKIAAVVTNRCTYERQKLLFRKMHASSDFDLTLVLSGAIASGRYSDLAKEIDQ